MINIPIWLFAILITLSVLFIIVFAITLIGYIRMCIIDNHDKNIHPGE